ncbi:GNAT family N-acetyltransferase [Marinomonas epiphytica]
MNKQRIPNSELEITKISAEQTLAIRQAVLWPELSRDTCRLKEDDEGHHYGVYHLEELVCVASIFIQDGQARLRKFATKASYQGRGVGGFMLRSILAELQGDPTVTGFWCDARVTAASFYEKFSMQIEGDTFYKGPVLYHKMSLYW